MSTAGFLVTSLSEIGQEQRKVPITSIPLIHWQARNRTKGRERAQERDRVVVIGTIELRRRLGGG